MANSITQALRDLCERLNVSKDVIRAVIHPDGTVQIGYYQPRREFPEAPEGHRVIEGYWSEVFDFDSEAEFLAGVRGMLMYSTLQMFLHNNYDTEAE